ncbi:hypothetical protein B0H13DRAFT_2306864 [Mycena leptocephala]|nr:hypothetical protein B0H13DRAFT_2306864 [Mycena leptocephala]
MPKTPTVPKAKVKATPKAAPKAKRAAASSAKAIRAAQIATAEALEEEEEKKPAKKRPGRPKKASNPEPAETELDELADGGDEDEDIKNLLIDWTNDLDLTWTLVTAIESDEDTQNSLFPGIGGVKLSGGKPKTHYYYKLAQTCFGEHERYKEAFARATQPAEIAAWCNKIKNRIVASVNKAKAGIKVMGETGAGIGSAAEITPGTALKTKWDEIKAESPWFFHSSSAPDDTHDLTMDSSDDDLPPIPTLESAKRKRDAEAEEDAKPVVKKKTKPQPSLSVPAGPASAAPTKKPTNAKDRFAATVLAEEEMAQRALSLKKEKNRSQKEVALAKIKAEKDIQLAKAQGKRDQKAAKADLIRLRMEQEHQIRLAQIQAQMPAGAGVDAEAPQCTIG